MIWPDFKTAVACTGSEQLFQLILQEKFHKPLLDFGTMSTLLNLEKKEIIPDDGFLYFPSWVNIYLTEDFITQHFILKTDVYQAFNSYLGDIFEMIGRAEDRSTNSVRSATYSFFYKGNNGKVLIFQMQNKTEPSYIVEGSDFWVVFKKDIYNSEYLESLGLNGRQVKAVLFAKEKGKITNSDYQILNTISRETATRDINELIDKKLFKSSGMKGAGAYYTLN